MAQKKLTLTTPVERDDLTILKASKADITFDGGRVELHVRTENAGATDAIGDRVEFTLPEADLKTIENTLLDAAQTAEVLPAGDIADV